MTQASKATFVMHFRLKSCGKVCLNYGDKIYVSDINSIFNPIFGYLSLDSLASLTQNYMYKMTVEKISIRAFSITPSYIRFL